MLARAPQAELIARIKFDLRDLSGWEGSLAPALSPAPRAQLFLGGFDPGAYAPGSMLTPAPQAENIAEIGNRES